jgi:2-oxoglutarate ferredoxin oxidoreductase subunit beta
VFGSLEDPVNPLLYVLAYGARYVAQGTPADMPGLAALIEEGIRYPGFAFINVQSPCITYGQPEAQLKVHKSEMKRLEGMGHDPADRLKAMDLAQEYGRTLYTGVFYRDPAPVPTYEQLVAERQRAHAAAARSRSEILEAFVPLT